MCAPELSGTDEGGWDRPRPGPIRPWGCVVVLLGNRGCPPRRTLLGRLPAERLHECSAAGLLGPAVMRIASSGRRRLDSKVGIIRHKTIVVKQFRKSATRCLIRRATGECSHQVKRRRWTSRKSDFSKFLSIDNRRMPTGAHPSTRANRAMLDALHLPQSIPPGAPSPEHSTRQMEMRRSGHRSCAPTWRDTDCPRRTPVFPATRSASTSSSPHLTIIRLSRGKVDVETLACGGCLRYIFGCNDVPPVVPPPAPHLSCPHSFPDPPSRPAG